MKWNVPEKPTTDSESPWHGDFESRVGYGVTSCATETVIDYITMIFFFYLYKDFVEQWLERWTSVQEVPGSNPAKVIISLYFYRNFLNVVQLVSPYPP